MDKDTGRARHYEVTDFSGVMARTRGRKVTPVAKRITMNISERVYNEANELDSYFSMGYQNVLKTAMTIGLTELYHQVSAHRVEGK